MPTALVVDGDPVLRDVYRALLTLHGYTVADAADGVAALEVIQAAPPDLVILDNDLPRMTGLEVLRHLQALGRQVAVILISALLDPETSAAAQALGVRACLQKPVGVPDLARYLAGVEARPRLRVLLADDHPVVRQGLAALLGTAPDFEVVGEASDGREAVDQTRALLPDVVLMDITMPRLDGIAATRAIKATCPGVCVIGLSVFDRNVQAQPMLEAGAVGYVSKTETAAVLFAVIRTCRAWAA